MKTGRPTVPPDYVSEKFENVKLRKKKYLFFDFYVYFKIELKCRKSFRHFFSRFYLILPIGNPVSS
jgi:hypothetical protein